MARAPQARGRGGRLAKPPMQAAGLPGPAAMLTTPRHEPACPGVSPTKPIATFPCPRCCVSGPPQGVQRPTLTVPQRSPPTAHHSPPPASHHLPFWGIKLLEPRAPPQRREDYHADQGDDQVEHKGRRDGGAAGRHLAWRPDLSATGDGDGTAVVRRQQGVRAAVCGPDGADGQFGNSVSPAVRCRGW